MTPALKSMRMTPADIRNHKYTELLLGTHRFVGYQQAAVLRLLALAPLLAIVDTSSGCNGRSGKSADISNGDDECVAAEPVLSRSASIITPWLSK